GPLAGPASRFLPGSGGASRVGAERFPASRVGGPIGDRAPQFAGRPGVESRGGERLGRCFSISRCVGPVLGVPLLAQRGTAATGAPSGGDWNQSSDGRAGEAPAPGGSFRPVAGRLRSGARLAAAKSGNRT